MLSVPTAGHGLAVWSMARVRVENKDLGTKIEQKRSQLNVEVIAKGSRLALLGARPN